MSLELRGALPGEAGLLTDLCLRSKAVWGYDAAFMAACRSKNANKAKQYYPKLPPSTTTGIVQICVRNGITLP